MNLLKVLPSGSVREQNADCAGDLGFNANRIAGMSAWGRKANRNRRGYHMVNTAGRSDRSEPGSCHLQNGIERQIGRVRNTADEGLEKDLPLLHADGGKNAGKEDVPHRENGGHR